MSKSLNTNLLKLFFDASLFGFAHLEIISYKRKKEKDYRFLEVNPAFEKFTCLKKKSIEGKTIRKLFLSEESTGSGWYGHSPRTARGSPFRSCGGAPSGSRARSHAHCTSTATGRTSTRSIRRSR